MLDVQRRLLQERNAMVSAPSATAAGRKAAEAARHISLMHIIQVAPVWRAETD